MKLGDELNDILLADRNALLLQIDEKKYRQLIAQFVRWLKKQSENKTDDEQHLDWLLRRFSDFISAELKKALALLTQYETEVQTFQHRFRYAVTESERRHHILEFATTLGANEAKLEQDKKAFDRWFSEDAVRERHLKRLIDTERLMVLLIDALGRVAGAWLSRAEEPTDVSVRLRALRLSEQLRPLLAYARDERIRKSALQSVYCALSAIPSKMRDGVLAEQFTAQLKQLADDRREVTWVQCEALACLSLVERRNFSELVAARLRHPGVEDDLFVRRRALLLLPTGQGFDECYQEHEDLAAQDSSPYVRQALLQRISGHQQLSSADRYQQLLYADSESSVRVAALCHLPSLMSQQSWHETCAQWLIYVMANDPQEVVLRTALKVLPECHRVLLDTYEAQAPVWLESIFPVLESLHTSATSLVVRRYAAQSREWLWCQGSTERMATLAQLQTRVTTLPLGRKVRIKRKSLPIHDELEIGRILALIAQREFGFDISFTSRTLIIIRGERFGQRMWRILYEFFHPSTDKRQGFSHTIGRHYYGSMYIPSGVLAEQSQTKVPGEPLQIDTEGGWRNYLPLVDELLSACEQDKVVAIRRVSSEGITEVMPPRNLLKRMWVMQKLTRRFSEYAELRNWQEGDQQASEAYINALQALGFQITFKPHQYEGQRWSSDPAVNRFFPAFVPLSGYDWSDRVLDYFVSVYENSLQHLSMVLVVGCVGFFVRHLYLVRRIRRARKKLPLVIGGWGTRGKSGTERLKAALFNAMGYNVVSKTTGCEAMFIYSRGYSELKEMFLFRPYDKATIWEQANLLQIATELDAEIFLWECMALNPDFVSILQQQWMNDDIATITNCYPDHENLQGPAGINIPQVMQRFIPKKSRLVTSEENMLPLLSDEARRQNTQLRSVGWLQAAQITPDILQRFPYQEHPYNVALVLGMCDELEIEHDFALKEIADRVVEDLGVLKCYPLARVAGRQFEFINGMSANERFGTLDNWKRVGLLEQSKQWQDDIWIATVVNNRADRVVRSQVFSEILVNDISIDRCYLIGSNLDGLQNYIQQDWAKLMDEFSLWNEQRAVEEAQNRWQIWAERMRVATSPLQLHSRLSAQLNHLDLQEYAAQMADDWQPSVAWLEETLTEDAPNRAALLESFRVMCEQHQGFCDFKQQIEQASHGGSCSELDEQAKGLLEKWFKAKFVVVDDMRATGEQVLKRIIDTTPPGLLARIMGLQNIKGTGLDFIYRLQAWETCHRLCAKLYHEEAEQVRSGLSALLDFHEYGQLGEEHLSAALAHVDEIPTLQTETVHAELEVIGSRHRKAMEQLREELGQSAINNVFGKVIDSVESFADAGDAVRRRKRADQLYTDLANQHISSGQAAIQLKALNSRQKGGWLAKSGTIFKR